MKYTIKFKRTAIKDLDKIDLRDARRILEKIKLLENGLTGDVKKLTNYSPEYRLRVGIYRVLFEIEDNKVIIYRIRHRKESYK